MANPVKYSPDEFVSFYTTQTKTLEVLNKIIEKFKTKDKRTMTAMQALLGLDEQAFDIGFDIDNSKVEHIIEIPKVTTFYQIKLKIVDKETGKDISRSTYICGFIKDGKPSKNFEIKQILGKTKAKEVKKT